MSSCGFSRLFILLKTNFETMSDNCLSLAGSLACPMYEAFQIGLGSNERPTPFNSSTTFDAWFETYYGTLEAFADTTKAIQRCDASSTYSARRQRYARSVQCFLLVDAARENGCSSAPIPIPLCKTIVTTFLDQYNLDFAVGNIAGVCAPTSAPPSNPVDAFNSLASRSLTDTNCLVGLESEVRLCGFYNDTQKIEVKYCKAFPKDGCCSSSAINGNIKEITLLLPLIEGEEKAETTVDESIWSTGIIIGVAFAAFVGILSIILICVLVRKRSKSSSRTRRVKPQKPQKVQKPKKKSMWTTMKENRENKRHVRDDWEGESFRGSSYDKPMPPLMPDDDHQEQETMQVLYNYVPNLQDEIYLYVGDSVIVKAKFDDGWALGLNITTKQEGSFPLACVGPFNNGQGGAGQANVLNRRSSLYLPSEATQSMYSRRYEDDDAYNESEYDDDDY
jgi:hypothetical protein